MRKTNRPGINTNDIDMDDVQLSFGAGRSRSTVFVNGPSFVTNNVFQTVGSVSRCVAIGSGDVSDNENINGMISVVRRVEELCHEHAKVAGMEVDGRRVGGDWVENNFEWSFESRGEYDPSMLLNMGADVPCADHTGSLIRGSDVGRGYVCVKYSPQSIWVGKTRDGREVCRVNWRVDQLKKCKPAYDDSVFD